jgi:hypothetical protein
MRYNTKEKGVEDGFASAGDFDYFSMMFPEKNGDAYLCSAWVKILSRNIARDDFVLLREGDNVKAGPLYELFRRPNRLMSQYDLWKETAA